MKSRGIVLALLAALTLPLGLFATIVLAKNSTVSTPEGFRALMEAVSMGWNEGNARKAAECFSEDAVYMEPPDRQVYVGRKALFEFFGGNKGTDRPMHMMWHHLSFDESTQVGFGEYTFALNHQYHGVVVVNLYGGKIRSWREYQYKSDLDWRTFTGKGNF